MGEGGVSLLQLSPLFASIFPLFLQKRLILRLSGFLECSICQLIGFYSEGQSFFFHGHQYNYNETVPIGKANHHLFYLFIPTIKLSRPGQT